MSFGGPNNSVVRDFVGGVRAASYWIGNRLLSASDIVNDSSVTGATVKAALNTLSTSSTAVFPFVASGLAEQDLVSYDASAATWRNRTKAAALKGTGTDSFVIGSGSLAAGTNDIILGPSSGASANTGNDNIGIGADTLDGATVALQNVIAIGGTALSGALTAAANGTVAIGAAAGLVLTSGAKNTFAGFQSGIAVATGSRNALYGYATKSAAGATDNTFIGNEVGTTTVGSYNVAVGSQCLDGVTGALTGCVALGYSALSGSLTTAADGATAVGYIALGALTTGAKNTAVGYTSGLFIIDGSRNSLFGWGTASSLSADDNTFIGSEAGSSNVGSRNTAAGSLAFNSASAAVTDCVAMGYNALTGVISSTAPSGSVAIGSTTLQACTTGRNTAVGFANQIAITTGTRNTTVGYNVMSHASTAVATSDCVGVGNGALAGALTATANGSVAVGSGALASLTSGLGNTAVGYLALDSLTTSSNTAMGYLAGKGLITGFGNSLFGQSAMYLPASSSASYNAGFGDYVLGGIGGTLATNGACAFGAFALSLLTSGGKNTAVGFQAGNVLTTGANMSILGYNANGDNAARSGCVVLGTNATATVNDTLVIRMGDTSTKEIVVTPVVNATPPAGAVTYLPITIGGTSYKILLQAP